MLRLRATTSLDVVSQVGIQAASTTLSTLCSANCAPSVGLVTAVFWPETNVNSTLCGTTQTAGIPCVSLPTPFCEKDRATFVCGFSTSASAGPPATVVETTTTTPTSTPTSSPAFSTSPPAIVASTLTSGTTETSSSSTSSSTTFTNGNVTSPTNTPKPAKTHAVKSNGVTSGAAAGIAIGCLIAGAAIAALVFFFLFKRYKKRQQAQSAAYNHQLGPYNGTVAATPAEKSVPIATATAISPVDALLPQPAEDNAIIGELSIIRTKIKDHAQTYYHTAAVDPVMVDESEFQDVARATGIRSMALCDMLLNPRTRIATIRLFLSYAILSRCGGQGGAGASLLPPEVGLFADTLAGIDGSNAGQLALKSKWHSISATLLSSRYSSKTISDSDPRSHSIAATLTAVDGVLRPFVISPQDDAPRLRNLQSVIQRAASFAFLLFSQPSTFVFQWSAQGKLVVFPALLQTSDENARLLNPPRVFANMETA
ncbi:hypothetical protein BU16DRAFT_567622 [Lophium mytilinum]|uniref:Uncharacterized protein n=1 Tax=Lophium mytilinum TaxID=390894 RepID=A0A6A6QAH6_9PEZI|nr:hypothetical protein BU16DRAFT_567622 [Lophium mytilinum]